MELDDSRHFGAVLAQGHSEGGTPVSTVRVAQIVPGIADHDLHLAILEVNLHICLPRINVRAERHRRITNCEMGGLSDGVIYGAKQNRWVDQKKGQRKQTTTRI